MTRRKVLQLAGVALVQAIAGGCGRAAAEDPAAKAAERGQEASSMSETVKVSVFNPKGELVGPIAKDLVAAGFGADCRGENGRSDAP